MSAWLGLPELKHYRGLDLTSLTLNHAFIIANTSLDNLGVYSVTDDCYNCPYKLEKRLQANKEVSWKVDTSSSSTWRILKRDYDDFATDRRGLLCQIRPSIGEFGVYRLDIGKCDLRPEVQPINIYLPFVLCSLLVLSVCIVCALIKFQLKRKNNVFTTNEAVGAQRANEKMQSLHLFRGVLTMLLIFITSGGGGYPIFKKEWGGLSLADCLFFIYAWTIGVNIPTNVDIAISSGSRKCSVIGDIFMRSLVLIIFGASIDSIISQSLITETSAIWRPLQKLGAAYFTIASIYVLTKQKFEMKSKSTICKALSNIMSLIWCWIMSGFLLAFFIIMMVTLNSFNCQFNANPEHQKALTLAEETNQNCKNNLTIIINTLFLAVEKNLVHVDHYYGFSDGLLGIISTILYSMIGLKAGTVYLHHESHSDRLRLWSLWAILFGAGGVIFAVVSHPLQFNLWPICSILILSTLALHLLCFIYTLTDIWKFKISVLSSIGGTSLIVLSGHLLFSEFLPFTWIQEFHSHLFYLLQNVWIMFLWSVFGITLMKKNIRISI